MLRTILNIRFARLGLLLGVGVLMAGCGERAGGGAAGPTVVAGTTQAANLARAVAGDRAEVVGILGPSSDPHEYEPRPSDAEALTEASLVLRSGGDVDLWLNQLVESSGSDGEVVVLLDAVETIPAGEAGEADPHWWQSPANAALAVEAIRDALIEVDPAGRAQYERNGRRYGERLRALDREIAACIERIPADRRKLVTSHDSLGYFADRYGIEVIGSTIPALTTQAQPSAGETADLVELIETERVAAVFGEVGVSESLEQAIADETGAALGTELYADSLGPADSPGDTYIGAAAANAEAIAAALGGGLECGIEV